MDFEALVQRFYEALLQPGDVAVDVGAHSGRHAVPMARRIGPTGTLHCFEPLPEVCRWLAHAFYAAAQGGATLAAYTIHQCALGAIPGRADFVHAVDLPEYSGLRERMYLGSTRIERVPVDVRTLDEVLVDLSRCSYMKIDAEGGELDILRGARRFIAATRPVVSFEFGMNGAGAYGVHPAQMFDYWAEARYELFDILGRALARDAFVDSATRQEVWD